MKIRTLILIMLMAIVLVSSCVFTWFAYHSTKNYLINCIDEKLYDAAVFIKAVLPADYHDRIRGKDSVSDEEYEKIVNKYDKLCLKMGLQYLWSVMILDGNVVFTSSTSPSKNINKKDYAGFLDVHMNPEVYEKAFDTMKTQYSTFHNQWGEGRMALVPGRDKHGRKYIFAASEEMTIINGLYQRIVAETLCQMLIVFIICFLLSVIVANILSKSIMRLSRFSSKVADGNMDANPSEKGIFELEELSQNLDRMDKSIKEKMRIIRESEDHFRNLVERTSDWIWEVDREGVYTYVSPNVKDILGYDPDEVTGMTFYDFMDEKERVRKRFSLCLEKAEPITVLENECIHKNGGKVVLETNGVPIFNEDGSVKGYRGVDRDITERKSLEQTKNNLVRDISHGLKTPIAMTEMAVNLIRSSVNKNDVKGLEEAYGIAMDNIKKMNKDISTILQAFTVDIRKLRQKDRAGRSGSYPKTDIRKIINKILSLIKREGIIFEVSIPKEAKKISMDKNDVEIIIGNIIDNAVKFTETGTIVIKGEKIIRDRVKVKVIDPGCGISDKDIKHVYEKFYKKDISRDGTGLGLNICKDIVDIYGGDIKILSEGEGKGTQVVLTLPA